jgi:7-carboxy-7-deazaguanine synthase
MFPLNIQPREGINRSEDDLELIDIWTTIQGEGPFAGMRAIFVRLAGCNLECKACDTTYTDGRFRASHDDAIRLVHGYAQPGLVVVTGGEPFRQKLGPLVRGLLLKDYRYHVQIETNGTLYDEDLPWYGEMSVVCSPKMPKIHPDLDRHIRAYKYIVREGEINPTDGLPTKTMGMDNPVARPRAGFPRDRVFVQPLDEQDEIRNKANVAAAVESVLHYGYRLSYQIHKLVGVR